MKGGARGPGTSDAHSSGRGRDDRRASARWTPSKAVTAGAMLGGIALTVWLLLSVRDVLLLAMLAILFAVLLDACVQPVRTATGLPRGAALAAIASLGIVILLGIALLLAPLVSEDIGRLGERVPQSLDQLEQRIVETTWGDWLSDRLARLGESTSLREASQRFLGFFSSAVGAASGILVVFVLGLFFVAEPDTYVYGTLRLLPPKLRARGEQVARELGHALRWWLLGRLASLFIVFVSTLVGLLLLDVPLAFLLALIAGVLSFVPTFGPLASAVPALLVALSLGLEKTLWVAILYLGIQFVESYSITPFIERRTVRLAPALLLTFQLVMGVLAGILGVLLATPILVVLSVLVSMLYLEDRLQEETSLP